MNFPAFNGQIPSARALIQPIIIDGSVSGASILRLDKIHPVISGNKWLKLSGHIAGMPPSAAGICSWGGPWSNHLHAVAGWCFQAHVRCKLVVAARQKIDNKMLADCNEWQAQLVFAKPGTAEHVAKTLSIHDDLFCIPFGGEGIAGQKGVATFFAQPELASFHHVHIAAGTGTTAAGIASALQNSTVHAMVPGLSAAAFEQLKLLHSRVENLTFYHQQRPRFGKATEDLTRFMNSCFKATGIETDHVYTARLLMHLWPQLTATKRPLTNHLIIHTGGLQGNRSVAVGKLKF